MCCTEISSVFYTSCSLTADLRGVVMVQARTVTAPVRPAFMGGFPCRCISSNLANERMWFMSCAILSCSEVSSNLES